MPVQVQCLHKQRVGRDIVLLTMCRLTAHVIKCMEGLSSIHFIHRCASISLTSVCSASFRNVFEGGGDNSQVLWNLEEQWINLL